LKFPSRRGLRIDLRGIRYRMGDCQGSIGNVSITPGGLGQVLLDQLDARASFLGALVLSGGTPPFAFNQTIDLSTLGTRDLDIRGIYALVPGPNGIGVRQQLAVSPFNLDRFTFGGFELEVQITLAGGHASLVGQAPFEATRQVCCAANTPVGTFFDRLDTAADSRRRLRPQPRRGLPPRVDAQRRPLHAVPRRGDGLQGLPRA
jgi:hypothetical protein